MRFECTKEPYRSRVLNHTGSIKIEGNQFIADIDFIYDLVRSTGLKSKKKRHILKRYKLVVYQMLKDITYRNIE